MIQFKTQILTFLLCSAWVSLVAGEKYEVRIDLRNVVDDRVQVVIELPQTGLDSIEFRMPKIVPGTYKIYDFGRFIHDFEAYDSSGQLLEVNQITPNRRLINNAQNLRKLTYWVEDTYDTEQDNKVFEPAGTNIEEGKNFIINTYGFVGYLQGFEDVPYIVQFDYPKGFFGASALARQAVNDSTDIFSTQNYFDLADGPIMYSLPDTAMLTLGNMEVLIAIYSPNQKLSPAFVKEQIQETLKAQQAYLGGALPVDNYAFLIYLFEGWSPSGGMGALEHSYSSVYSLPEINPSFLAQTIRDVAAHEFFHIVTPLNIHSEEIGEFDFINPKMSKHLWLYEGVTEYAAGLAQVKYGAMSFDQYLDVIEKKISASKNFDDRLPFTVMSANCLDQYANEYYNVYQKGALIGLALDIKLRALSDGKYGIQNLMDDLAREYGKNKSFKDEELFGQIAALTFPEIRKFFAQYVEGPNPLDYEDIFKSVGVEYTSPQLHKELSLGHISFGVNNETNRLVINSIDALNEFGKEMGYLSGDEIYAFDGVRIDIENYEEEFRSFKNRHQAGDVVKAIVLRTDEKNGKQKKVKLKARTIQVDVKTDGKITPYESPTAAQSALRKAWINQ